MKKYIITGLFGVLALALVTTAQARVIDFDFDINVRDLIKEQRALVEGFAELREADLLRDKRFVRQDEIVVRFRGQERFVRMTVGASGVADTLARFQGRGDVVYAEPNYTAYAFAVPNDPFYSYQWHFQNGSGGVNAEDAWNTTAGGGVVVAVIDTGVAYENYGSSRRSAYYQAPDLAETAFVPGYDFVNNDTHPNDDEGHGTHVAGTIAQSTNNGIGVAGIAYNTAIMPVKVLDSRGSGSYADVAEGIRWAVDNGADVINLSLGGPSSATYLEEAVAYAYNNGVTVVAASGNDNGGISYPAAYDEYVIAVGATRYDEQRAPYSNYGGALDIVAPGGDVTVDQNGDGYGDGILQQTFSGRRNNFGYYFYSGTSMATPHVAAIAALLIANGTATTPDDIETALSETAKDLGASGWDEYYGYGLVNAKAALLWNAGPTDNPPSVTLMAPASGATIVGTISVTADASDDNGVNRVEFSVDGGIVYTDTTVPYEYSWDSTAVADGAHTLSASAYDSIGQSVTDSASVMIDNVNDAPVADAGADQSIGDSDGSGSESVTLDGSGSFDSDGSIVSYEWKEGTTVLATTDSFTQDFAVGVHTVTLTVIDDDGAFASDNVIVTVTGNQAPTADAGVNTSATTGNSVSFDGSGSSDPDGSIVSYEWDFGDSTTASGAQVSHSYASVGDYTVTLTITDNGGLIDADTLVVTVSDVPDIITVFEDSFESGLGKWTQDSQNDWFRSSQRSVDGNYSAEVDGRARDAVLTSNLIDLQGKTNATITFSWYIERRLDSGEYIAFEVSTDGGSTWIEKTRLRGNVDQEDVWHVESFELTGISNLQLRFLGKMSSRSEDANVDSVQVVAQ